LAAINNHPELIDYLLTSNTAKKLEINFSSVDGDKCTMLHHAARKGSVEALKKILELAPQLIYEPDIRSNTALHYAAMGGILYTI
jgi:ankyrin repeat protein